MNKHQLKRLARLYIATSTKNVLQGHADFKELTEKEYDFFIHYIERHLPAMISKDFNEANAQNFEDCFNYVKSAEVE